METHDGFPLEEWTELSRIAIEFRSSVQDWLKTSELSRAMVEHQLRLRDRAAKKFSDPDRWLWSVKLFEQSSDEKVAALMASAYPPEVRVVDFCCGAGSDTVALARRGAVTAVDRCEVACGLTRANLGMHFENRLQQVMAECASDGLELGTLRLDDWMRKSARPTQSRIDVVCANAEAVELGRDTWVHIDPDRRADSRRTIQASHFQPGLSFLAGLIHQTAGGSIKLAPATKLTACDSQVDRKPGTQDNIELEKIGRQFIAWGGSVRQQRWWWNVDLYPTNTLTLSVLDRSKEWHHWTVSNNDAAEYDGWSNIVDDVRNIQGFIGDANGCVRAANLQGLLAKKLDASLIGNPVGFFQKVEIANAISPLVDWFQIEAVMAFDRKRLRSYLRQRNIGTLEIKVRNAEIAPELLRKEMKLGGTEAATLLITKCGLKTIAIVAKRGHQEPEA